METITWTTSISMYRGLSDRSVSPVGVYLTRIHDMTYKGERLRAIAFPLGGIGTGHFCLRGDGSLSQWQIFNQVNHLAHLPGTFMAVRTESEGEEPVALVLQSGELHVESDFEPAPSVSDHLIPQDSVSLVESLPSVESLTLDGRYPIAQLRYEDHRLPVDLTLVAFSPLLPLNAKDSGIPASLLIFRAVNNGEKRQRVALMISLQNAAGWDGLSPIEGVVNPKYGGNVNTYFETESLSAALMECPHLDPDSPRKGELALAALRERATARAVWDDLDDLWADFESDGRLESTDGGPSRPGRTWNTALCVQFDLAVGEEREVAFAISWFFPNRYVNWDQTGLGVEDRKSKFWLGNMYSNWFDGARDVVEYVESNLERLRKGTEDFHQHIFSSTLPTPVVDAVSSQISTIRSPTCLWTEDGKFHGFEGCCGESTHCSIGGCCPLDCTHVWNYEQTLSRLFPDLERKMRKVDLDYQMGEDGGIPHRTPLPLYLPRWRSDDPTSSVYAADGHCGTILKTYREYRASGDEDFLDHLWPSLKKALNFAIRTWDGDEDGVFSGPQWNTYDLHLYGHNSFVSDLYLAALRSMEEMARIKGEFDLADRCHRIFESGSKLIDDELWNGEYYVQKYDPEQHGELQYGDGCHCDQLLGQWWAHILDLGYILQPDHVRKALESIFRYNLRDDLKGHKQQPRVFLKDSEPGLLICTWPRGGRRDPVTLYSDEVWTGIEYAVAGLMFYEGMMERGLEIVRRARQRHDGRLRSPWNEVECGDHYVRPMSSWAMWEAISGYIYDGGDETMEFDPKVNQRDFRCLFLSRQGWGSYHQLQEKGGQVCTIEIASGRLALRKLTVPELVDGSRAEIEIEGRPVDSRAKIEGHRVVIEGDLRIEEGQTMTIKIPDS